MSCQAWRYGRYVTGITLRYEEEVWTRPRLRRNSPTIRLNRHLASLMQCRRERRTWRTHESKATCILQCLELCALLDFRGNSELGRQRVLGLCNL